MTTYPCVLLKIIDGDTLVLLIDKEQDDFKRIRVRLVGINCPEISGEEKPLGVEATVFTQKLLGPPGNVRDFILKGVATLRVAVGEPDKYGRWLAKVTLEDGRDLADELVKANHAKAVSYRDLVHRPPTREELDSLPD